MPKKHDQVESWKNKKVSRAVMEKRVMSALQSTQAARKELGVMVLSITPDEGLAGAYEQMFALRGTEVWLLGLLDRLRQK